MARTLGEVQIIGKVTPEYAEILTPEALDFVVGLDKQFNVTREKLLADRNSRQRDWDAGMLPDFLPQTRAIRDGSWQVAPVPADLVDRRVEITGPAEVKMMINAFNSGANVFMVDFEDALSPTWHNVVEGQIAVKQAVRRTLSFTSAEGKQYKLRDKIATMVVRPRGWHLHEKHVIIDGKPVSASLFDFAMCFYHNAHELIKRGSGPYFYLPKMESHLEARLWNDVFNYAQDKLNIPRGTIKVTVLIETILGAFEMDEILYELRDHMAGLNAGRWDYIFSMIKKFSKRSDMVLPDRAQVTMAVPFMKSYCDLLVQTCHKRGAHAMGGMAAFIPSRKNIEINERALAKVREDKEREAAQGFDGTWVAHPDLVPVAKECFDNVLGANPNQKQVMRHEVRVTAADLVNVKISGGTVTEAGVRLNIDVALQYIESWLRGIGAAAIHNLMEDAATAEISRAQLWQWIHCKASMDNGQIVTQQLYETIKQQELSHLTEPGSGHFVQAAQLLDSLINSSDFTEFLTVPAYVHLNNES